MEHSIQINNDPKYDPLHPLIVRNISSPLSGIPFHHDVESIERLFAKGYPLHLAIHRVKTIQCPPAPYTDPHLHDDFDEINILIGDELQYRIQLGEETFELKGNFSIWIPAGTLHAANVLSGEGYFVAIRLHPGTNYFQTNY